jgi:hypothetical protein
MIPNHNDPAAPRPEQLAAFADGELDGADKTRVEEWLAGHPEAAAEVEGQRRLDQLWRLTYPPAPCESRWEAALAHVEARLEAGPSPAFRLVERTAPRRTRAVALAALALTAAALVLLCFGLDWLPGEPFPVTSPDDVDIISMEGNDNGALVVGEPPVPGPLVLAAPGEVTVERVEADADGVVPRVLAEPDRQDPPMMIAPLATESDQEL